MYTAENAGLRGDIKSGSEAARSTFGTLVDGICFGMTGTAELKSLTGGNAAFFSFAIAYMVIFLSSL